MPNLFRWLTLGASLAAILLWTFGSEEPKAPEPIVQRSCPSIPAEPVPLPQKDQIYRQRNYHV